MAVLATELLNEIEYHLVLDVNDRQRAQAALAALCLGNRAFRDIFTSHLYRNPVLCQPAQVKSWAKTIVSTGATPVVEGKSRIKSLKPESAHSSSWARKAPLRRSSISPTSTSVRTPPSASLTCHNPFVLACSPTSRRSSSSTSSPVTNSSPLSSVLALLSASVSRSSHSTPATTTASFPNSSFSSFSRSSSTATSRCAPTSGKARTMPNLESGTRASRTKTRSRRLSSKRLIPTSRRCQSCGLATWLTGTVPARTRSLAYNLPASHPGPTSRSSSCRSFPPRHSASSSRRPPSPPCARSFFTVSRARYSQSIARCCSPSASRLDKPGKLLEPELEFYDDPDIDVELAGWGPPTSKELDSYSYKPYRGPKLEYLDLSRFTVMLSW